MNSKSISEVLSNNEAYIKKTIGESFDTKFRHFSIPAFNDAQALIVNLASLIDVRVVDETILKPLMELTDLPGGEIPPEDEKMPVLTKAGVFTSEAKESKLWSEILDAVMEGDTALLVDDCNTALILTTRKYEGRAVAEAETESEAKGPKDGFVENIQTNAALIRRRIKDYGLRFDIMKIGDRTKTNVAVAYIDGIANDTILKEVKKRLSEVRVDAVTAAWYVEEMIKDAPYSIFPTISSTERPDKVCSALLDGRIAILVDNTPFMITLPITFWDLINSSGDYYQSYYLSTFIRWIRLLAMFLSISASAFYVLLTSFHQEMLPTALALKIAAGRQGVPFPAVGEAVVMELVLEIMKEAGLRMPKSIGQTVSIVGTLVIGQSAVSAGLVGPLLVIVIGVAAISSFAIPYYDLSNSFRLLRFPVLFLTAFFGLLGYLAAIIMILLYLMSLRSFGAPYLSPVMPFNASGNKDVFIKVPLWSKTKRPQSGKPKDSVRIPPGQKPKPPS